MADWNKPTNSSNYQIDVLANLKDRDLDSGNLFLSTPTNPVTGMIRYNRTTNSFQEYNGTTWIDKVLSVAGGGTGTGSLSGIVAALGLGTMSTQNSNAVNITGGVITGVPLNVGTATGVLPLANGGTGAGLTLGPYATFLMSNASGVVFGTDGRLLDSLNASNLAFGTVPAARLPNAQIVQNTTATTTGNNTATYADITNLNVTITPTTTASKILVQFSVSLAVFTAAATTVSGNVRIMRNIGGGAFAQVLEFKNAVTSFGPSSGHQSGAQLLFQALDAPNTISPCIYKAQFCLDIVAAGGPSLTTNAGLATAIAQER